LKAEKTGCLLEAQGGDSGFRHTPYVLKTKKRYIITTRARLLNNTPDTKNKALKAPDSFSILGVLESKQCLAPIYI
jgi:hypothetical protein